VSYFRRRMRIRIDSHFWRADWHLSFLLGLLLLMIFVIYPMSGRSFLVSPALQLFFSLILISGVAVVAKSTTARGLAAGLAIGTAAIGWTAMYVRIGWLTFVGMTLWITFFAILTAVILARVFDQGDITFHRIQGAIAAYLLLGVIWAGCYRMVMYLDPGAFNLAVGDEDAAMSRLVYFSFATLTTVGYGDVTALNVAARSLAMLEALTGQLFPAVLIARLISMEVSHRKEA